jgi:hypothetical protein
MQIKKIFGMLLLLFFLGYSFKVYPQNAAFKGRNSILFAPFNTLDIINPSIQIGFERSLSEKFALQIEGGYILNHSLVNYLVDQLNNIEDCPYTNKGYKARTELKYIYSIKERDNTYFSLELFYMQNKSGESAYFLIADTNYTYSNPRPVGTNSYYDFFYNYKQRIGLNFKLGAKLFISKHLFAEPHIGLGIVYRISEHSGRENPIDKLYDEIIDFDKKPGNLFIPNFPFNIKMGYRF